MLRAGIMSPLVWTWAIPSSLGRDHKILGVGRQRFGDQLFADVRTVRVRGVYEIDAQLHRTAKYSGRRSRIFGRSPDPVTGDTHSPEANAANGKFTAERDGSASSRRQTFHCVVHIISSQVIPL